MEAIARLMYPVFRVFCAWFGVPTVAPTIACLIIEIFMRAVVILQNVGEAITTGREVTGYTQLWHAETPCVPFQKANE